MKKIESAVLNEKSAGSLHKISDHVYWMKPDKPDRPSLCAVVGNQHTLMLDAGASSAHIRLFVNLMVAEGLRTPRYVALTHWHWDHIFGLPELDIPIIAHRETVAAMKKLATYEWSDAALDARVASGQEIASCASDIKLELPEPRQIKIVLPDIVFTDSLTLDLGGVTCQIQHIGGDHAADSCVIFIEPDRVLFGGDVLYDAIYAPVRHYTPKLFSVIDALEKFDFQQVIEGHNEQVMSRTEMDVLFAKMRYVGTLVDELGLDETAVRAAAEARQKLDEDTKYYIQMLIAGRRLEGERQP